MSAQILASLSVVLIPPDTSVCKYPLQSSLMVFEFDMKYKKADQFEFPS